MRYLSAGLLFLLIFASPFSLAAITPLETARLFYEELLTIMALPGANDRNQRVNSLLDQHFNFDEFYKKALAGHWSQWNQEQKESFHQTFKQVFGETLSQGSFNIKIIKRIPAPSWSLTSTGENQVATGTGRIDSADVTARLYLVPQQGQWRVYDLDIAGVSLSRNYRGNLNYSLQRWGFEGLVQKLSSEINSEAPD